MKRFKLVISLFLIVVLSLSLPVNISAQGNLSTQETVTRLYEVEEMRETNSETYLLSNGSYECVVYAEDKYYLDDSKNLQPIDNSIKRADTATFTTSGQYKNTANAFDVYFSDSGTPKVDIVYNESGISFTPVAVTSEKNISIASDNCVMAVGAIENCATLDDLTATGDNTVIYNNAFPDTDLVYVLNNSALKEYIVLNSKNASNEFRFMFTLENVTMQTDDNSAYFTAADGSTVFTLDSLFAVDANGVVTENLTYSFAPVANSNKVAITVTLDEEYLSSSDRAYPVVIDPTIMISSSETADACVCSNTEYTNYQTSAQLRTGYEPDYGTRRSYIKFNIPSSVSTYSVTNATLDIEKVSGVAPTIRAYRCTGSWSSSSITWSNKPNYTTTDQSTLSTLYSSGSTWYTMNVTSIVQSWVNGVYSNYGFVLKDVTESDPDHWTTLYSSDADSPHKPELHITYSETDTLTFAAFDIGDSSEDEVALVAEWMNAFGYASNGTYDNVDGNVSPTTILNVARNSDVVYINGHGERYANIKNLNSSKRLLSYICADVTVNTEESAPKYGVGAQWLTGSTTKTTSCWNNGTKWIILAPCSQLDHNGEGQGEHWNGLTSAEVWARTMLGDGQRVHGYVGYYNIAPGASTHTSRLNNFFNFCMYNNYTIVDAWAQAHTFLIGSSDWAAIYHSANTNDRFQSMSANTTNGAAYEIYYVGRNMTEQDVSIASTSKTSVTQSAINNQYNIPLFTNSYATNFSSDSMYSALQRKLDLSGNAVLEVSDNGRITYSIGEHNWGKSDLNYELSDSEAISIAEQKLNDLGLLPQSEYRAVVSRVQRVRMELDGTRKNIPETIEYTVSFYRTYNGIDILSDQEDGIIVGFNKNGLTELRHMWRSLDVTTNNLFRATETIALQKAQNIYQSVLESQDALIYTDDATSNMSSYITTAYLQIGDEVNPVWVFSTDSNYANCVFVDMNTGEVLSID